MKLYRYSEYETNENKIVIELIESSVIREDSRFYYVIIDDYHTKEIRVSKKARNRLAWPTKLDAYNSYVTRKYAQIDRGKEMIKIGKGALSKINPINKEILKDDPTLRLCACGRLVTENKICVECDRIGCSYCVRWIREHRVILREIENVGDDDGSYCFPDCAHYEKNGGLK